MANQKNIRTIYAILSKLGIKDEKEELVYQYTDGQTTSLKAMRDRQAEQMIADLSAQLKEQTKEQEQKRSKMIRSIYSIAYDLNLTHVVNGKLKVETSRLNALAERLSPQTKPLQQHSYKELVTLVTIFKKYYKQQLQK